jgi:hypothetical protein
MPGTETSGPADTQARLIATHTLHVPDVSGEKTTPWFMQEGSTMWKPRSPVPFLVFLRKQAGKRLSLEQHSLRLLCCAFAKSP